MMTPARDLKLFVWNSSLCFLRKFSNRFKGCSHFDINKWPSGSGSGSGSGLSSSSSSSLSSSLSLSLS